MDEDELALHISSQEQDFSTNSQAIDLQKNALAEVQQSKMP